MPLNLMKRLRQSWCPHCKAPADVDCPDSARTRRAAAKASRRAWRREYEQNWVDA